MNGPDYEAHPAYNKINNLQGSFRSVAPPPRCGGLVPWSWPKRGTGDASYSGTEF